MKCPLCYGSGKAPQRAPLPCPECAGCGEVHCCEGDCAQPGYDPAGAALRRIGFATWPLLLSTPAFADTIIAGTPPPSSTTVAIGDALTLVLTACVPPVAAILAGALWKLWSKWGFEANAQDKQNMEHELQTALAFGVAKAIPEIKRAGWDNVKVHSQILADSANYLIDRFPARAAQIAAAASAAEIPATSTVEAVKDTLTARLPLAMEAAADSPATPPTTQTQTGHDHA